MFHNMYIYMEIVRVTLDVYNILKRSPIRLWCGEYRKVSNISRTLVGNNIVDRSDVVGASPVGAAPTTSSFST